MLAASSAHYGDPSNYLEPDHPLQRAIRQLLGGFGEVRYAVDGCGAPCFISDLSTLARTWLSLGDLTNPTISRIKTAMCAQPWYYSGTDRLDYTLASEGRGLLTKVGAAGLLGGILLDKGIAFALKIRDGSDLARPWQPSRFWNDWATFAAVMKPFFDATRSGIRSDTGKATGIENKL